MTVTARTSRAKALIVPLLLCLTLSLIAVGCVTLTGHSESCSRTKLFGSVSKMTCSGTVETVRGEGPLTFGESDSDEFSGEYRLKMTASVEQGRMDIYADTVDGGKEGGEVSPGNPLRIVALTPSTNDEISVMIEVKGGEDAEVKGLRYEATVVRVG